MFRFTISVFYCRIELKFVPMETAINNNYKEEEKGKSMDNLLDIPAGGVSKAKSMEMVNGPELTGWNSSRRHSDFTSATSAAKLRRNNYSFDDLFNRCQIHTSMMDFIDDSDNWSLASVDSSATDPQPNRMSTLSLASITANPGSRKQRNHVMDSGKEEAPVVALSSSTAAAVTAPVVSDPSPLHSNSRRGLSHSMILNWVFSKKYPTINESTDSPAANSESGLDRNKNSVLTAAPNVNSSAGNKFKFSYRDLNAVAPSNW